MQFTLVFANHGPAPSHLEDWFTFLECAITDAGHQVRYGDRVCPRSVNILLENFDDEAANDLVEAAENGVDYIIAASEFLTEGTFNAFTADRTGAGHYTDAEYWARRCGNFLRVADRARAIWCVSDQQIPGYRAALDPACVHRLELRFVPGFAAEQPPNVVKDIDFLFTGTMTAYRQSQLDMLRSRGSSVAYLGPQTPDFIRRNYVARTRVVLNIPQYENWPHPSQMRYFHSIMQAATLLSETCKFPCQLDPYVLHAHRGEFVDEAVAALQMTRETRWGWNMRERFRTELPSTETMAALIERSLSGHRRQWLKQRTPETPALHVAAIMIEEANRRTRLALERADAMVQETNQRSQAALQAADRCSQAALDRANAELAAFRSSTSWRVTAPLRRVRNLVWPRS